MLLMIKMYPDQVARHWDALKPSIEEALPRVTAATMDRMNRVFQALLAGQLTMYLICEQESRKIRGVITISMFQTVDMVEKQLLLYTVYGFGPATLAELTEAYNLIKDLAKGYGCSSIVAYSNRENVLRLVKGLGAEADLTFIRLEV